MSEVHQVSVEIGGTEISFETGKMAKQASGAVVVRAGDTMVLSTATAGNEREGIDFLPLTVDVEERMYAAGKIPGYYKRRYRTGNLVVAAAGNVDHTALVRLVRKAFGSAGLLEGDATFV